jgi:threonine/homoserine/homoserine lactone efflux protein
MFPSHASLLIFVGAAALLLAIPGPAIFYIVGRSMGHSRNAGLVSALGIGVGTLIHTAAAAVGLSALLVSSAAAFSVVKYLGAAYLIYLGVQKLRRDESFDASTDAPRTTLSRVFAQGIVVNVLNPKTALFFFAFLPQFIDPSRGHVATQILSLGILFSCWERSATASGPISPARSPQLRGNTAGCAPSARLRRYAHLARRSHAFAGSLKIASPQLRARNATSAPRLKFEGYSLSAAPDRSRRPAPAETRRHCRDRHHRERCSKRQRVARACPQ